jgi:PIF1-like helicase/Helitron helicase-like domain at N-terminus
VAIVENLLPGQQPTDRPDLIARVFILMVRELLKDLREGVLGPYQAHVYTIEYQKRGLPHIHILLWIKPEAQFVTSERINEVVSAELPNETWDPTGQLRELVLSQMTHGPCGEDYTGSPCMIRKTPTSPLACSKNFPKEFTEETIVHEDRYPEYRRRNDGQTFMVPKPGSPDEQVVRDNRWVVPYNPYLLQKYQCHMNVEICATVQAIKYIHKYVYKGADRTTLAVGSANDEIKRYVQGRYIGPTEAIWRLFEFSTHQEWPPVYHLAVHLEGQHTVYFSDNLTAVQLAEKATRTRSTLMAFFLYNEQNEDGRGLLYSQFPANYTWVAKTCEWKVRERLNGVVIGRIYHCSPVSGERYYLRLLLTTVTGPRSFAELYVVDGVRYPTYMAACIARGLAENDQEWFSCFDEAIMFTSGHGLRTLFLTGLRHQVIADPTAIWERYKVSFCEDLLHRLETTPMHFPLLLFNPHFDYGLYLIGEGLADQQRTLADFRLPQNTFDWSLAHASVTRAEEITNNQERATILEQQLNTDQKECFTEILCAITDDPQHAHFYLQGPGGTGKTFLYKTLCHKLRGEGKTVLCVASTGIAALLLPNGRTSHSQFKIPIILNETSVSTISKNSGLARSLCSIDLVIWDEVPMQHKYCFEVVSRLLADLRSVKEDVLFGGVPVVLGGDFAQILPVVPQGSRADIVSACLQRASVWPRLRKLRLRTNMRVYNAHSPQDQAFVRWISALSYTPALNGSISIPPYVSRAPDINYLIDSVYPRALLQTAVRDMSVFQGRAILSPLNTTVTELNLTILDRFPGAIRTYNSVDSADVNEESPELHQFPAEMLQSINLASLPPSRLSLKIGVPVMLLRNLCPQEGLCNGTRMVVTSLCQHCIETRLIGGDFHGQLRIIPRIKLSSGEKDLTFTLTRKQFPVRLCFAMTINKSQGQSFDTIGIDLRSPVFSHGQFYVAVSRVSSATGLHILLPEGSDRTSNIVWPEVLQDLT